MEIDRFLAMCMNPGSTLSECGIDNEYKSNSLKRDFLCEGLQDAVDGLSIPCNVCNHYKLKMTLQSEV